MSYGPGDLKEMLAQATPLQALQGAQDGGMLAAHAAAQPSPAQPAPPQPNFMADLKI